jgi:hypothetical protein
MSTFIVASGDNFEFVKGSSEFSNRQLNLFEIVVYVFYQYVLNFPLSIFNWFTEKYLYTTYYFILPNSLAFAWLVSVLLPYKKKEINKVLLWVLIPSALLAFVAVGYSFIQAVFLK